MVDLNTKKAVAETLGLSSKNDFHVTIIGSDTGEEILSSLNLLEVNDRNEMLDKIHDLCLSFDWQVTLKNDFFFIEKAYNDPDLIHHLPAVSETRKSIIQMAEINNIHEFYSTLNALL